MNSLAERLKHLSTNSDEQHLEGTKQSIDDKSRLQLRAPPHLSNVTLPNIGNAPISDSTILSPTSSTRVTFANDPGPMSGTWFANSNGLDSLINHQPVTMCNNDSSHFDDDLPSLLAKQVCEATIINTPC